MDRESDLDTFRLFTFSAMRCLLEAYKCFSSKMEQKSQYTFFLIDKSKRTMWQSEKFEF